MANQTDIAKALNITQATVSRALRGDRTISAAIREKVLHTAEQLGYNPNNYLSVLMSNIRSGKKLRKEEVIGLLIEDTSLEKWHEIESYRTFHQGVLRRAHELGIHIDPFFLKQPGMDAPKIDRILHARGITGIILAPPYHGNRTLNMDWRRYAAIGIGFGWEKQELNRVAYDNFQAFLTAFKELRELGYRRIGTVFDRIFIEGNRRGINWYPAYLDCQSSIPKTEQIPLLADEHPLPGEKFCPEKFNRLKTGFEKWLLKWKPDAVLTMTGEEKEWIKALGIRVPQEIGVACLSRSTGSQIAGIDQNSELVGATAIELIAAQIARNEFGPPTHQKVMMIEGVWVSGSTVQNKNRTTRHKNT